MIHYDALAINRNMALDLPFREGVGTITHSLAKTHPLVTIVDVGGVWTTLDSYLQVLTLDGANDYLWASNADTLNLDFGSDDYSVGGWFWFTSGGDDDKTLMGRWVTSNNGWEVYHYKTNHSITCRHHHAAGGSLRTSFYSNNWTFAKWWFVGISRTGTTGQFYRGDINSFASVTTIVQAGGLEDPETCAANFNIGRSPANENNHNGCLWRPRAWFNKALTEAEWQQIWEKEVEWFRS